MSFRNVRWIATAKWAFVLAIGFLLVAAEPAMAQRGRGSGRGGRGGIRTPQRTDRSQKGASEVSPGAYYGRILEFEPSEGGGDDELGSEVLGTLKLKPVAKGSRVLKMTIRKSEELRVTLAGHTFEAERLPELLRKGLYCSADWMWDPTDTRKKPIKKELRGLTIDVFEVEGEIMAIEDDHFVLKARPANGQDWRHLPPKEDRRPARASDKPKRVRLLKVKLRVLDEVTKFTDAADHELDLTAFEVGQSVTASIAYGSKMGILAQLRTLTIDEDAAEAEAAEGGSGDRGRGVGPRGRGGQGEGGTRGRRPSGRGRGGRGVRR